MSTRRPNRQPEPAGTGSEWLLVAGVCALVVAGLLPWAAAGLAGIAVGVNPFGFTITLLLGRASWSQAATLLLLVLLVLLTAAAIGLVTWRWRRREGRDWADRKAEVMATKTELTPLASRAAAADAARLHADGASRGVRLADAVRPGVGMLAASWEWVQLWIMGPRAGKTSCVVVPQICATQGPVFATSNKRDVVDLARPVRERVGRVWVFDLQQIIGETASWWWNPLDYVTGVDKAVKLARLFSAAVSAGDQGDSYFEPEGEALLSQYLLAAAKGGEDLTAVRRWLHDKEDRTAVTYLHHAGEDATAEALLATMRMGGVAGEQSEGIYGTARKMTRFLADQSILDWVTPQPDENRPRFDPHTFVRSAETMFALSKEGAGTARALTAALTVAVAEAGEAGAEARADTGGRLSPPLLMALDEVANICRWPELPDLYSHYGSKGIVLASFLQSYSQAEDVWGKAGVKKLWSAANICVVGANVREPDFLKDVSELIGDQDISARTVSANRGQSPSVSTHLRQDRIFTVAELAALPGSRAVLFASGIPPALMRLVHYTQEPWAADITGHNSNPLVPTGREQTAPAEQVTAQSPDNTLTKNRHGDETVSARPPTQDLAPADLDAYLDHRGGW